MHLFDLKTFGKLETAEFLERPNRFVGHVRINGRTTRCHVADTGRLKEILHGGRQVLLAKNPPHFKTEYRLLAARVEEWVLINTGIHSRIVRNAINGGILGFNPDDVRPEVSVDGGRLDFLVNNRLYIEVKGTNLLDGTTCRFPDAPSIRARRHLEELIRLKQAGFDAMIYILGLRNGQFFAPNSALDPEFGQAFRNALAAGVRYFGRKIKLEMPAGVVTDAGNLPLSPGLRNG